MMTGTSVDFLEFHWSEKAVSSTGGSIIWTGMDTVISSSFGNPSFIVVPCVASIRLDSAFCTWVQWLEE